MPFLSIENELPLVTPPAIPLWSENYCLQAYDPKAEIGFWLHMGLPVYDSGLWHDITIIYLPGGEDLLIVKNFTPRAWQKDPGPVGAMLRADYDADNGKWVWRFHGAAQRVRRSDLQKALLSDGVVEPVSFELGFSGLSPVWDLSLAVRGQVWSNAHWEQPCDVTGWIEYSGKRVALAGAGVRDHSRGARDFSHMGPHFWLHGHFSNGLAFGLLHVAPTPGQPILLSRAYVVRNGQLEDAEVVTLPADRSFSKPFEIRIRDAKGEHRIGGELLHEMPFTVWYPNEILFGHNRSRKAHLLREGQVRWTWDGEIGYGLGERTVTIGDDGREDEASISPVILGEREAR